jgi:hypothetical protein
MIDELIGAPKLCPLMVESWIFCVETCWKRAKPATSNAIPAVVPVLIPTLELTSITIAGTALLVIEDAQRREEDPGSNTILPVVCKRILSLVEEPLNRRSSCVPSPVETSAKTVLLYWPMRP